MEDSGVTLLMVIASAAVTIGLVVGMTAITWVFLLAAP
jgi:hypothetical protein